jgi:hypothetical protein
MNQEVRSLPIAHSLYWIYIISAVTVDMILSINPPDGSKFEL